MYVKSIYPAKSIVKSDPIYRNSVEYLIVEIKLKSQHLLFSIVYCRPGAKKTNEFFNHIIQFLPSYNHIIITGDFNLNGSKRHRLQVLLDALARFLVPSQPTHHTSMETSLPLNSFESFLGTTSCKSSLVTPTPLHVLIRSFNGPMHQFGITPLKRMTILV